MKINKPHLCPEWDYMEIYPNTPEWESCLCTDSSPESEDDIEC